MKEFRSDEKLSDMNEKKYELWVNKTIFYDRKNKSEVMKWENRWIMNYPKNRSWAE